MAKGKRRKQARELAILLAQASCIGGGLRVSSQEPWVGMRLTTMRVGDDLDDALGVHGHDRAYVVSADADPVLIATRRGDPRHPEAWGLTRAGRELLG